MRSRRAVFSLSIAAAVLIAVPAASAIGQGLRGPSANRQVTAQSSLGSSFLYQGRLTDGGTAPTGIYDIRFVLFDAATDGEQVEGTPIITRNDVQVTTGLFTVELDFGDGVFDGQPRWVELAVKPGASGTFTVLAPRQPVMPIPQALYAANAGGLQLPFESVGEDNEGNLLSIVQSGSASAIAGSRTYEGANEAAAVLGSNAGAGAGVQGTSDFTTGVGVSGDATGQAGIGGEFSGRTGVKALAMDTFSTALEVSGALKVSGANRFAFVHTSTGGNTFRDISWINSSLSNGDPNALVSVTIKLSALETIPQTPVATVVATPTTPAGALSGISDGFAVGVVYIPATGVEGASLPQDAKGKWAIVRLDGQDFPAGVTFNVTVVKQ